MLLKAKIGIRSYHFWIILTLLAFCTANHYFEQVGIPTLLSGNSLFGLSRHTADRVFYLALVVYAGYTFGAITGLVASFAVLLLMLPRAVFISVNPVDALFETTIVILAGVTTNLWFKARSERVRAIEQREQVRGIMAVSQGKLRTQIRSTMKYEKDLAALSGLSSLLAQSPELESLLSSATNMIMGVMGVDIVLIFSLGEEANALRLISCEGVSLEFAGGVEKMKLGEGFNGRVAETAEPLVVEDASQDPRLSREAVRKEGLHSQLIVPMKSRARVVGTLCIGMHQYRQFTARDIALLTVMGNEIGTAIDNIHLCQEQSMITDQLRQSEKHYRELFENAHDAIWIDDMEGNIISANRASEILTGFNKEELLKMKMKDFLSPEDLEIANEARRSLLQDEPVQQPYRQRLIRKDGTQAILRLTTNLSYGDGQSRAFQNIARDVTEEAKMQESLRSYVRQITKAQEDERLRISRELHDSTAQNLIALLHTLENFLDSQENLPLEEARELWAMHEQVKDIVQGVRSLSRDLRPAILDDVGLLAALHWVSREFRTTYGIKISLHVHGSERRFVPEVELLLFRIIQEALRNVGRHSHASNAEVLIEFAENKITASVRDNGIGFQALGKIDDLSRDGKLGLVGMQERVRLLGGNLEINSEPGKGTSVIVEAPV